MVSCVVASGGAALIVTALTLLMMRDRDRGEK
jgi:hypothetical protein